MSRVAIFAFATTVAASCSAEEDVFCYDLTRRPLMPAGVVDASLESAARARNDGKKLEAIAIAIEVIFRTYQSSGGAVDYFVLHEAELLLANILASESPARARDCRRLSLLHRDVATALHPTANKMDAYGVPYPTVR